MKCLLSIIFLFHYECVNAQMLQETAPDVAAIGAYSSTPALALNFGVNQAALGSMRHFAAAVYGEKRFLLQELSTYHVAVVRPAGDGAFGVHVFYSGSADYNTMKTGFAYGRNLGKHISLGVQFDYWNQHIRGYGNEGQVSIEAGVIAHVSDVLHVGFQLSNPATIVMNKWNQKLPRKYAIGVGYQPSQLITLVAELIETAKQPLAINATIEYHMAPKVWAKAGINSYTKTFFIAGGFQLTDFTIEVVGSVHPQLGLSPGVLLAYNAMDK